MYAYEFDEETGGLLLTDLPLPFSKEPRPVYFRELDILGFDRYWNYEKDDSAPYLWAEANNYFYRGRKVAQTRGGSCYTAPKLEILQEPEPDGAPLKFVDIPAMVEKNREILESLAQDTIKKTYNTYEKYRDRVDVFYVAFSGGKDSIVTLDIVQRALAHNAFKVLFGDTGMEFPDTYDVVDKVERACAEAGIDFLRAKSELSPEYTWRHFGPPSQTIRWCCSVHKTAPQILLLRKVTGNSQFRGMAFTGIRGDESISRSEYADVSLGEKIKGQYSCHPILGWNSAELFAYTFARGLLLNATYKKGNSRAGCLVCPLAAPKNIFFKEKSYSESSDGNEITTKTFNDIILETTSKELSGPDAVKEFMDIGGWKARRSGKELSIARNLCEAILENGILTITLLKHSTDWRQWIKTVGNITYLDENKLEISFEDTPYLVSHDVTAFGEVFTVPIASNTNRDIRFMSALKTAFRKSAYCLGCKVCQANCPNGYITFHNGRVMIDDKCISCKKCHKIDSGCLLAYSLALPKGERKMGSVDRYGNLGVELNWVRKYFEKKDEFWDSPHGLGEKMIEYLRRFLNDSGITEKTKFTEFGAIIDRISIESVEAWALMVCNLAYTPEYNWWIKNTTPEQTYTADEIISLLGDDLTSNSKMHIVSAYKNIFTSTPQVGKDLGLGICDIENRKNRKHLNSIHRSRWLTPEPRVILYSLYKFAEACGGYYQFTLKRLLNHEIDSEGVSPTEIFGLGREQMEQLLTGLSVNYPEFIDASFTHDLDNITLRDDKTSRDVLTLF